MPDNPNINQPNTLIHAWTNRIDARNRRVRWVHQAQRPAASARQALKATDRTERQGVKIRELPLL